MMQQKRMGCSSDLLDVLIVRGNLGKTLFLSVCSVFFLLSIIEGAKAVEKPEINWD